MSDPRTNVRVDALGSLRVHRGPVQVDLGPAKQRAVFVALVLQDGQTVSTDALIEVVWGDDQPSSARQLVHTYVARLRRLLEPELPPRERNHVISSVTGGGYRINLSRDLADVSRFRRLLREAKQHLSVNDTTRAFDLLGESMRLWRDPDLTELSGLFPSPGMLDPLRRMWCDAAVDYVGAGLDLGEGRVVLPTARQLVEIEPMNEIAQARYLVALEQTGRRAAAIEHFNTVRVKLHVELGVPPGAQLSAAYRRVITGDAAPAARRQGVPAATDPFRPPWRGPGPEPGPLLDRDRDLDAVTRILAERRLLSVTGPPGCGKSALALLAAARVRDDFLAGVVVVECARVTAPDGLAAHLVEALGGMADVDLPAHLIGSQHVLLVLDNAEHLIEAAVVIVEEVVRACPNVSVVVTSREPLGLPYESVWRLATLPVTDARDWTEALAQPAVELFARRADQVRPGFRMSEADAQHVATLCRRLDGLPLAVELAAECLAVDTLDELMRRLDDPLHELRPPRRGQPAHHRSLLAAFRRSVDCLDPDQRWCFARLGGLPRSFRAPAAERVFQDAPCGRVNTRMMLAALADKSLLLVRHDAGGPAYSMLGLLHRYAVETAMTDAATPRQVGARLGR